MILVISNPDGHTRAVVERLRQKGAAVVRFDPRAMPKDTRVSAWLSRDKSARVTVRRDDTAALDLSNADTVWFRRLAETKADGMLSEEDGDYARKEATAYLYSLGDMLKDRFCVNPIVPAMATDHGRGKVSQLEAARRIGMDIPETLASNDPRAVAEFMDAHPGGIIMKTLDGVGRNLAEAGAPEEWGTVYTTKLDSSERENLGQIRFAPCIFQELVPKRFDLRVTVMGDKVFGTEIHSQVHPESSVDFRSRYALDEVPYAAHEVPFHVAEQCRKLNRELGLVFGAFDFVVTPDGRYLFLEVNQMGQFLWLEEMTGQPLLENFCEMLIQRRTDFKCDAPMHAPGRLPEPAPTDEFDVYPTL